MLLVRHGRTPTTGAVLPGRAPGLHLSEDGKKEAAATAERIAALKAVAAVYASPLERARETADIIAARRGLVVLTEPGLLECDIGDWTGWEIAKAAKTPEWATVQRYPSGFRFPGGESFTDQAERVRAAIADIRAAPGRPALVVCHRHTMRFALGGDWRAIDNAEIVPLT